MRLIRNLLALIGLVAVLAILTVSIRLGPTLAKFDDRFLTVYQEFADKLLETGDPGVSMMWSVPVNADLSAEDVVASMKSIAVSRRLLFVGELPFYKQVQAITGEDYRYVNFLSFCDAQVGRKMLEYRDHYSGFMPCRIALVEDKNGRLWMHTMNLDLMIHGGKALPADLKADAVRVRENIRAIMEGAARGGF